jgi:ketosteroid isomerase-like protein
MSQEKVEIIASLYENFLARPERLLSPEIESFQDVQFVPRGLADAGDQIVATVEFRGTGRESGIEVRQTVAHAWTLREGRIIAWHVYFDPAEALEAVGLSE